MYKYLLMFMSLTSCDQTETGAWCADLDLDTSCSQTVCCVGFECEIQFEDLVFPCDGHVCSAAADKAICYCNGDLQTDVFICNDQMGHIE